MTLDVNISYFVFEVFFSILETLYDLVWQLDNIIVFDASLMGIGDFTVSLLDFNIGIIVVSIVIGAFVHVNKADNFYSNRKD